MCEHMSQVIGRICNVFGELLHEYKATRSAIVVGKNTNPVCQTGDRLVHLGFIGSSFKSNVHDGH
jgi:predicted deacylase